MALSPRIEEMNQKQLAKYLVESVDVGANQDKLKQVVEALRGAGLLGILGVIHPFYRRLGLSSAAQLEKIFSQNQRVTAAMKRAQELLR